VRSALLQFPDPPAHTIEAALGFRLPFFRQISSGAQSQMHAFVEVVAGLAVATDDVLGDMGTQEVPRLLEEHLIVIGQLNP
jgi:hypothetical protein